jgi:hypothetical protein
MTYFGKNGVLQVVSVVNKIFRYSYQMSPGSKESIR